MSQLMKITSTHIQRPSVPRASFDGAQPSPDPAYSNTKPDGVSLSDAVPTMAAGLVTGAGLGLAAQAAFGGLWGVAGAVTGAAIGAVIAKNYTQVSSDAKGFVHYYRLRHNSDDRAAHYKESDGALRPLTEEYRVANDPKGDVKRLFDGYDSSRNITGLLAQEGKPEEPFRVAVELANLRPLAETDSLQTTFLLGKGENAVPVRVGANGPVGPNGQTEGLKAKYSTRFNQLILEVDKKILRDKGWQDGQPLNVHAETRKKAGAAVFDQVDGVSGQVETERLFRWEGKTIYQIMTDRFSNGDHTNDEGADPTQPERYHGGDWQGVVNKLDYLKDMGVDCIWLSCPYENDRDFFGNDGYHGYWPHDFRAAEPSFGSKEKLQELVSKAHEKGMKVMLDVVVNHTGYNHPAARDPQFRDWFHQSGPRNPLSQYGLEHGSLAGLPDLAQENPKVSHYLIDVHKKWIEDTDVDGFRMDAVRHVPDHFLQDFDSGMKSEKEGFTTIGEVFWNDPYYLAEYQNGTQDSLFDFPLMEAVRDVFGGNPDLTLKQRWDEFQQVKQHNFGQAIMDLTKQGGQSMQKLSRVLAKDHVYDNPRMLSTILDNHDTGRFLSHAGGDKAKLKLAAAFLYGCRGTPSIYYGTESGMEGQMGHNREDMQFDADPALKDHFQHLIAMRKSSEALQMGTQNELAMTDTSYAFSRVLPGEEVVCCYNNSEVEETISIPLGDSQVPEGEALKRMDAEGKVQVKDGKIEVTLPAKGFAFYGWKK